MYYPSDGSRAIEPRALTIGERVKLSDDRRRWWTVKAVTEHFAALTRQAEFKPAGTVYYTVLDWRNGVRGPCDLVGQAWGDGTYSEKECAEMLAEFESGYLEISQRNWGMDWLRRPGRGLKGTVPGMTDRHSGYVVALDKDIRKDDAEYVINAIRMIKGVVGVTPVSTSVEQHIAEQRAGQQWRERLYQISKEMP